MQDDEILKYLKGSASTNEIIEIENWISSSNENTEKFNLLKAQYIASTFDKTIKTVNHDESFEKFENAMLRSSNKKQHSVTTYLKYAAMIALIFGSGYFYINHPINDEAVLSIPDEAITLTLENGNIQVISEGGTTKVVDSKGNLIGTQQGTALIYKSDTVIEELTYNTLTVPYGKRFDIVLSDGTKVLLNSGTSIKYPVKFIEGENRQVFLSGEAFFNVTKDSNHPFIVQADGLNIRVLGTQFNVSSFPEDEFTDAVLVEGSVSVYTNTDDYSDTSQLLTPGHKASLHKMTANISIEKADVALYTAWTNGKIIFRHMPFNNIAKKLERHYNVAITNNNNALNNELFTASFDIETIEQVFKTFKSLYNIDYTIKGNQIIIN